MSGSHQTLLFASCVGFSGVRFYVVLVFLQVLYLLLAINSIFMCPLTSCFTVHFPRGMILMDFMSRVILKLLFLLVDLLFHFLALHRVSGSH